MIKKSVFILDLSPHDPARKSLTNQLERYGHLVATNGVKRIQDMSARVGRVVGVVTSRPAGLDLGNTPVLVASHNGGVSQDDLEAWLFYSIALATTSNVGMSELIRDMSIRWDLSVRQSEFLAVLTHAGTVAEQARVIGVSVNTMKTITRRTLASAREAEPEESYATTSDLLRGLLCEVAGGVAMASTPAARGGRQKRPRT